MRKYLPGWVTIFWSVVVCLLTWRVLDIARSGNFGSAVLLFLSLDTVVKVKLRHVTHLTFVVEPSIWDELCSMKRNILYNAFRALHLPSAQQPPQTNRKKHECNHNGHGCYNVLACDLSVWLPVTQSRIMHAFTLRFVVSHSSKPYWIHR